MKIVLVLSLLFLVGGMIGMFYHFNLDRSIKNWYGSFLQYGTCPNCGDSWWWKEDGSIPYSIGRRVVICNECLNIPEELDIEKIVANLTHYGWEPEKVELVRIATKKYKEKNYVI